MLLLQMCKLGELKLRHMFPGGSSALQEYGDQRDGSGG